VLAAIYGLLGGGLCAGGGGGVTTGTLAEVAVE